MKRLKQADREQHRIEMKIYRKNKKELGWLNELDKQQHSNENPEKDQKEKTRKTLNKRCEEINRRKEVLRV